MDDARRRESDGDQSDEHSAVLRLLSSDEWQKRLEQARQAREHVLASRPERRSGLAVLGPDRPTRLRPVPETADTDAFFDEDDLETTEVSAAPPPPSPLLIRPAPSPAPGPLPQIVPPPLRVRPRAVEVLPELAAPVYAPAPPPPAERTTRLGVRILAGFALGLVAGVGTTSILWMTRPAPIAAPVATAEAVPAQVATTSATSQLDAPSEAALRPVAESLSASDALAVPAALGAGPVPTVPAMAPVASAAEPPVSLPQAEMPPRIWAGGANQLPAPIGSTDPVSIADGPAAPIPRPHAGLPTLAAQASDPPPDNAVLVAAARPSVGTPAGALAEPPALPLAPTVPDQLPDLSGNPAPALAVAPDAGTRPGPIEPPPNPRDALARSDADQPPPPPEAEAPLTASTPPAGSDWADVRVKLLVPVEQNDSASSALAGKVRNAGFMLDDPASVDLTIKATHVRFYHPEDRAAAEHLAAEIGGDARDFTNSSIRVPDGTIELWMQGSGPASAKPAKAAKAKSTKAAKPARQAAKPAAPREDPQVRVLRDKVLGKLKTMNKS